MSVEHAGRTADVGAMIRVIRKSQSPMGGDVVKMRQLIADLCRLVAPGTCTHPSGPSIARNSDSKPIAASVSQGAGALAQRRISPRMRQTLVRLLAGDQEKQVARRLGVSQHTVHIYVKALYRHFEVNSRGELMSKFVQPVPHELAAGGTDLRKVG